jgi:hypothetical protein
MRSACQRFDICRQAEFRTKFDAAIVSIRRRGHRLNSKLGDVCLQAGDELVFDVGDSFNIASDIVRANLQDVGMVEEDSMQEFMVAFRVGGDLCCTLMVSGLFLTVHVSLWMSLVRDRMKFVHSSFSRED